MSDWPSQPLFLGAFGRTAENAKVIESLHAVMAHEYSAKGSMQQHETSPLEEAKQGFGNPASKLKVYIRPKDRDKMSNC